MRRTVAGGVLLIAMLILVGVLLLPIASTARPGGPASLAAAPAPTPTYVSELAPAVVVGPDQPAALPSVGARAQATDGAPTAAAFALALLGTLLIRLATPHPRGR